METLKTGMDVTHSVILSLDMFVTMLRDPDQYVQLNAGMAF